MMLDTGALIAIESGQLKKALAVWQVKGTTLLTTAPAWCEFWRGRGGNDHVLALIRKRVRVESVDGAHAEAAAEALRAAYPPRQPDPNPVRHAIDAMLLAFADRRRCAVMTGDQSDLLKLWPHFSHVTRLLSLDAQVVIER